ncbi:MAG: sodium ion-translocating decarboxylase subunit beta [Tidjanibacter sp.]|nr:sodium ion-translocating decarboxylase subunit beta [Tidjanibacter sp.]
MTTFLSSFVGESIVDFLQSSGIYMMFVEAGGWKCLVMLALACFLLYLAIKKQYEPLLLLPIAFGMLLTNLPGAEMFHSELFSGGHVHWEELANGGGLLDFLYLGVKLGIYPCLIFIGVGAMTDFGPLIANPKSFLMGAAAQIGIFMTFIGAYAMGFTPEQAGSIGIIGGADGPTSIYLTSKLAPELLGPIAIAAYSYMALVPVIQPPIMRGLTTEKERQIKMTTLRQVSKTEKIVFPIVITIIIALILPSAAPLIGCLMLGNLMKECGVVDRLAKTVQNELMNIVVILLGITVGATATADAFLNFKTLGILALGIVAFSCGTAGGVLLAKLMNVFLPEGKKINPLIGSAGVSAVPMAARVSQNEGLKANPSNYLLMHAMGANVSGVIGSAVAAGILLCFLG